MTGSKKRVRAYALKSTANAGKLDAVRALLPHWQRALVHVQLLAVRNLKSGGRLGLMDTKGLPHYLSQRQWKSVVNQVNTALRSWQELAVPLVRRAIAAGDYDDALRHELFKINLRRAWWTHPETTRLVEAIARTQHPFPNLSRVRTMLMDGPIASLEESDVVGADYWLRISTLKVGVPVRVPLIRNSYFDGAAGGVRQFVQVHVAHPGDDPSEAVTFRLVKQSEAAAPRESGTTVGLDWGLKSLLTTSDGRQLGQTLHGWLGARDTELTNLQAALSRNGVRFRSSRRWRNLTARIRGHVKNEIGRILNRLAERDVKTLVFEDLDFRGAGLSPRLRRIVSRAGRAALKAKLTALADDHGVETVRVNPAHTSRECSGCGYTSKFNRTAQARFQCRFCSKSLHADVNAARVIVRRRSTNNGLLNATPVQVLSTLDQAFLSRWGCDPGRMREQRSRRHSPATSTIPVGV